VAGGFVRDAGVCPAWLYCGRGASGALLVLG
jgi:hypothetical protein